MSGRSNFLQSYKTVSAGDMSQATVVSKITNIQGLHLIGIQFNITSGTPTGTFAVQVSADHVEVNGNVVTAGTFITPTATQFATYSVSVTAGSPANYYFEIPLTSSQYIQLLYTKTSGTGTFDSFIVGKMV